MCTDVLCTHVLCRCTCVYMYVEAKCQCLHLDHSLSNCCNPENSPHTGAGDLNSRTHACITATEPCPQPRAMSSPVADSAYTVLFLRKLLLHQPVAFMPGVGRACNHSGLEITSFSPFGNLCPEASWPLPEVLTLGRSDLDTAPQPLMTAPSQCWAWCSAPGSSLPSLANPAQEQRNQPYF